MNAERLRVRGGSLADVLAQLGYGEGKVATALNGDFVPERMRASTPRVSPCSCPIKIVAAGIAL